jgi:hypothetical protein
VNKLRRTHALQCRLTQKVRRDATWSAVQFRHDNPGFWGRDGLGLPFYHYTFLDKELGT